MKITPELHSLLFNLILSGSTTFAGTFRSANNLICQKNTLWKRQAIPGEKLDKPPYDTGRKI